MRFLLRFHLFAGHRLTSEHPFQTPPHLPSHFRISQKAGSLSFYFPHPTNSNCIYWTLGLLFCVLCFFYSFVVRGLLLHGVFSSASGVKDSGFFFGFSFLGSSCCSMGILITSSPTSDKPSIHPTCNLFNSLSLFALSLVVMICNSIHTLLYVVQNHSILIQMLTCFLL